MTPAPVPAAPAPHGPSPRRRPFHAVRSGRLQPLSVDKEGRGPSARPAKHLRVQVRETDGAQETLVGTSPKQPLFSAAG